MIRCSAWIAAAWMIAVPGLSMAQTPQSIPLSDASGRSGARGQAVLTRNALGPDQLVLDITGLEADRQYTVFLAASPESGALPAQFMGPFRADATGHGRFMVVTEVQDAYLPTPRPPGADDSGISPPGTGDSTDRSFALPLNWIRVYEASPDLGDDSSAFGLSELAPGGQQVVASEMSFDRAPALRADPGPDIRVRAPRTIDEVVTVVLDGVASRGAVASTAFSIVSTPDAGNGFPSSCLISFEEFIDTTLPGTLIPGTDVVIPRPKPICVGAAPRIIPITKTQAQLVILGSRAPSGINGQRTFNNLVGQRIVVRLTVTDLVGNTASDDLIINLVR
jgi:hypothetical protein